MAIKVIGTTVIDDSQNANLANATLTGSLRGPSNLVIDPAAVGDNTGTVTIAGDLQVDGTTTTINSTTLDVDDLNITLASGATNSGAADGAGITIDGASANIIYTSANDSFSVNKLTDFSTGLSSTDGTFSGTVQASTITETSSLELKTDIDPLSESIKKLSLLNPVEFTRKSNGKREVGLIAEEVERVIPELVDTDGDYKTVSYSRLTAYLIDAIKGLSQVKNG